ncbi:MAG: ASCH domain-containing protein, partial [Clostridia bacterium]|nr:ASCH domain-containing protein [Clostridia bacterium]
MIDLIHNMFLATEPFDSIYNGIKTVEYRLYDEKRKRVAVGDTIIFTNRDTGETVKTAVTYIKTFDSFLSLFSALGCEGEPYRRWTARQLADSMRAYYTEEAEKEHGVVAIGIQLIGPALKIIGRVKNDFPTKF